MDIVERLNVAREGMEAGIDDWPLESRIYEYKKAAEEITELRAFKAACEKQVAEACAKVCDDLADCEQNTDAYRAGAHWCREIIRSGEWRKCRDGKP